MRHYDLADVERLAGVVGADVQNFEASFGNEDGRQGHALGQVHSADRLDLRFLHVGAGADMLLASGNDRRGQRRSDLQHVLARHGAAGQGAEVGVASAHHLCAACMDHGSGKGLPPRCR